jgi:peptidyl-dipeptidase A
MISLNAELSRRFSMFRAEVGDTLCTDAEIEALLRKTFASAELEKYWKAVKKSGEGIAKDFTELVRMRNRAAQSLGYKNYFEMRLVLDDHDPVKLHKIYDDFERITREPYRLMKQKMDEKLSLIYSVPVEHLMPWHYQNRFFQEAPDIFDVNLDTYYAGTNIVKLAQKYFNGLGLNIDDVMANSDLYDKPGKTQAGFSTDIDRNGDVRIIANMDISESSMNTILYESAYSAYLKNIRRDLPYTLREPSHVVIADAIATLFARFSSNPEWMEEIIPITSREKLYIEDKCKQQHLMDKLVFSRWAQVMYRFEKGMYENPDQDLNELWWQLVSQYQLVNRPPDWNNPDWMTKNHILLKPCSYHNYMIGELLASQFFYHIRKNVISTGDVNQQSVYCVRNKNIGQYMIDSVFSFGRSIRWDDLIEKVTGESLNPEYYQQQYLVQ